MTAVMLITIGDGLRMLQKKEDYKQRLGVIEDKPGETEHINSWV